MALTDAQYSTFAAAIRANTDPLVQTAVVARNDDYIRDWYNAAYSPTTKVWKHSVTRGELMDSTNITSFDGLTAGKRDAWRLFLEGAQFSTVDFGKPRSRKVVTDIWGNATNGSVSETFLLDMTRNATKLEMLFGGSSENEGTATATDLNVEHTLTTSDVSKALNEF